MKIVARAALAAGVMAFLPMTAAAGPLTYGSVKTMVEVLGYTTKDISGPSGEKFETTVVTESFNVPVGLEVSKSGRFIWCTAFLGKSTLTGDRALALMKRGVDVQPTSFWITDKDDLKVGIAIDNRDVTPEYLKFILEKLANDIVKTADIWQAPTQ